MDNNENNEQKNGNSYESSPEFHITNQANELTNTTNETKIDWKSTLRKHILANENGSIVNEEESIPWVINLEEMGITPLPADMPIFGQGGTDFSTILAEVIKELPKDNSLDNLANKIKTVNSNLNPAEYREDNKPKLK